MNLATMTKDPVLRFKLFLVSQVACNYHSDDGDMYWYHPLNPIIGETFKGFYKDGTWCY